MVKKTLKPITLKEFAAILELSQSTVSRIINGAGGAHRIAEETQQRVLHAAALYGYTANSVARSLRQKRSYTIGVIVPEISDGYSTAVLSGIEDELLKDGFFYFVVSHRHRAELLEGYPRMMLARSVEGIIAIDSPIEEELPVPLVSVSGHKRREGVINIELHHEQAAHMALSHLKTLGHRHIAFIKGQAFSSDTNPRWEERIAEQNSEKRPRPSNIYSGMFAGTIAYALNGPIRTSTTSAKQGSFKTADLSVSLDMVISASWKTTTHFQRAELISILETGYTFLIYKLYSIVSLSYNLGLSIELVPSLLASGQRNICPRIAHQFPGKRCRFPDTGDNFDPGITLIRPQMPPKGRDRHRSIGKHPGTTHGRSRPFAFRSGRRS